MDLKISKKNKKTLQKIGQISVSINKTRSYRDGNLMMLNFVISDRKNQPIFSINSELGRSNKYTPTTMTKAMGEDLIHTYIYERQYMLFLSAYSGKWFGNAPAEKVMNYMREDELYEDFLTFFYRQMIIQMIECTDKLDFFSLQKKEEYDKLEKCAKDIESDAKKEVIVRLMSDDTNSKCAALLMLRDVFENALGGTAVPEISQTFTDIMDSQVLQDNPSIKRDCEIWTLEILRGIIAELSALHLIESVDFSDIG